jgi:hypothetical protein
MLQRFFLLDRQEKNWIDQEVSRLRGRFLAASTFIPNMYTSVLGGRFSAASDFNPTIPHLGRGGDRRSNKFPENIERNVKYRPYGVLPKR